MLMTIIDVLCCITGNSHHLGLILIMVLLVLHCVLNYSVFMFMFRGWVTIKS